MDHMRLAGTLRRPDRERIRELAGPLHLSPTEAELSTFERMIDKALDMFDLIDTLPLVETVRLYPDRPAGRSPRPGENPLNAYITMCDVRGAPDGPPRWPQGQYKTSGHPDNERFIADTRLHCGYGRSGGGALA